MKWALVTGAAHRVGKAIAVRLARNGYGIILHFNSSRRKAAETQKELQSSGFHAVCEQADLSQPGEAQRLFSSALRHVGFIDVLINSASSYEHSTVSNVTWDTFLEAFSLNTLSPFELCRCLAQQKLIPQQERTAVAISLLDCRIDDFVKNHVAYLSSKQALRNLLEHLAIELAPNVRVNAVAPGLILPPNGNPDAFEGLERTNPLQRIGTTEEMVEAVLYLIRATYTTGQILFVDGGRHLRPPRRHA